MQFREAISSVFRNYAIFQGRARRSEYWYFFLFNILVYIALSILSGILFLAGISGRSVTALGGSAIIYILYPIYSLGVLIPSLALCCRRLHDIGRPGPYMLFILIPIVGWIFLLIWTLQEGDPGPNRYGPDPKCSVKSDAPVRKQTHAPQQNPNSRNDMSNSETVAVRLEGIAGCFRGQRISVHRTMVAGRHPDCDIRFPQDTHGVSHHHCQFRLKGSSLVVTDIGSSLGTFINEKRLQINQPVTLSPGDIVLLGSRKQAFRVL